MNSPVDSEIARRGFLKTLAGATIALPAQSPIAATAVGGASAAVATAAAAASGEPASALSDGYQHFSVEEAAFTEAIVDTMCPADQMTASGTACGLATFIDRQLAGSFGNGGRSYTSGPWQTGKAQQGYQLSLDPKSFFGAGVVAAQRACEAATGKKFQDLAPPERDAFLHSLSEGKVADDRVPLMQWFNELLYPLFEQACFADPIYGGNRDKVFWKMIGYPGLPAFNALNVTEFRGRPFPGAKQPQSIQDFS
jgi:gluconate 2-dehydrogenase gamma chain